MLSLRENTISQNDGLDSDSVRKLFGSMRKVTDGMDHRGPVGDGSGFNGSINSNCISDFLGRALVHYRKLQPENKPECWDLGHGDGLYC